MTPTGTCQEADVRMSRAATEMHAEQRVMAVQDLKCMVFSLIGAHFKIQPIQR